eukprot:CAMPEP_0184103330 /NCGR_PEP_ID=MMETSP0974-20121125/13797_1 /TAXON_ID=483370 /ORGANISM="non described non described, Strain CCMP2097" /LENGTH=83 /DNA_ID=CAMNT_0026406295 /DNA_START=18 /DNA_END=266 /DNA_ORIENTATION=+
MAPSLCAGHSPRSGPRVKGSTAARPTSGGVVALEKLERLLERPGDDGCRRATRHVAAGRRARCRAGARGARAERPARAHPAAC